MLTFCFFHIFFCLLHNTLFRNLAHILTTFLEQFMKKKKKEFVFLVEFFASFFLTVTELPFAIVACSSSFSSWVCIMCNVYIPVDLLYKCLCYDTCVFGKVMKWLEFRVNNTKGGWINKKAGKERKTNDVYLEQY